jgi:hypothetical protein
MVAAFACSRSHHDVHDVHEEIILKMSSWPSSLRGLRDSTVISVERRHVNSGN